MGVRERVVILGLQSSSANPGKFMVADNIFLKSGAREMG